MDTVKKTKQELEHCIEGEKVMLHFFNGKQYQGYFSGFDGDETIMLQALGSSTIIGLPFNMLQFIEVYKKSDRNMKGKVFSKVFETENGQVLVFKAYNVETETHSLNYQMDIAGVYLTVGTDSKLKDDQLAKKEIQTLFENCDLEAATSISSIIIESLI